MGSSLADFEGWKKNRSASTFSINPIFDFVFRPSHPKTKRLVRTFMTEDIYQLEHFYNTIELSSCCSRNFSDGFKDGGISFRISVPDAPFVNSCGSRTAEW